MDLEDQYQRILEHQRHMETRAFTTLGAFIAANAFMIVAWSQFYQRLVDGKDSLALDALLVLIAGCGYFAGLLWASLGARNWGYARRLVAELITLGATIGPEFQMYRILRKVEDDARKARSGTTRAQHMFSSHPSVLRLVPLALSLIYIALWCTWANFHGLYKHEYFFLSPVLAAFAVLGILAMYSRSKREEMKVEEVVDRAKDDADHMR